MRLFLLLILLWGATAGYAQTVAAPEPTTAPLAPANPAVAPAASPDSGAVLLFNGWYLPRYQPRAGVTDTTGALLSLFRNHRRGGFLFFAPLGVGLALALPISSTDRYGQTTVADKAISPPLGIPILAGTIVGFIIHATKFNKGHLLTVDKAYAAGQPIPAKYRRQLKDSHFAEAAYLREALRQQMERERLVRP